MTIKEGAYALADGVVGCRQAVVLIVEREDVVRLGDCGGIVFGTVRGVLVWDEGCIDNRVEVFSMKYFSGLYRKGIVS